MVEHTAVNRRVGGSSPPRDALKKTYKPPLPNLFMNLTSAIKKRASIRNYLSKTVKYDKVIDALEAANLAPSPGNLQVLKYIIIDEPEIIDKIAKACVQQFISNAPIVIAVCSDQKNIDRMYHERADKYTKHHAGAAIENFLLKITDMGLASCWVGAFSEPTIKNILKVPDNITVEAILPIAYENKTKPTHPKHKTELGSLVYFNAWKIKFKKPMRRVGVN